MREVTREHANEYVDRLLARPTPFSILVGAGISCEPPTALPDFSHIKDVYIGALDLDRFSHLTVITSISQCLSRTEFRPESFFQLLGDSCGDVFTTHLRSLLDAPPNSIHRALARIILANKASVITTNFDTCIERAAHSSALRVLTEPNRPNNARAGCFLFKIHGSVDDTSTILLSDAQLGFRRRLDARRGRILHDLLKQIPLIVMGYRGADEDIFVELDILRAEGNLQDILWICHNERDLSFLEEKWHRFPILAAISPASTMLPHGVDTPSVESGPTRIAPTLTLTDLQTLLFVVNSARHFDLSASLHRDGERIVSSTVFVDAPPPARVQMLHSIALACRQSDHLSDCLCWVQRTREEEHRCHEAT